MNWKSFTPDTFSVRPSRSIVKLWPTPCDSDWGGGGGGSGNCIKMSVLYVIHKSDMVHVHNAVLLHSLPGVSGVPGEGSSRMEMYLKGMTAR